MKKEYTPEQLAQQAGAFRLLAKRVEEYEKQMASVPKEIRDDDGEKAISVAFIAWSIISENKEAL